MSISYEITDEEGRGQTIELQTVCAKDGIRRYGVEARLIHNDEVVEKEIARERFITKEEAEETIKMLRDFQVTPCTLCDVI